MAKFLKVNSSGRHQQADVTYNDIVGTPAIPDSIIPKILPISYVYPEIGTYSGTVRPVANETEFNAAVSVASAGDIISLTADILATNTLVIDKKLKIDGAYTIQTAADGTAPVTLLSITGNDVYITSNVTIKQRKTTNTAVEVAVSVVGTGFISNATVEFMEFGYILKGSFKIGGKTTYTGALANNHRHIAIYNISAPSEIDAVLFDFPSEATPRASFVYHSSNSVEDKFNAPLKISNCKQLVETKIMRQFYLNDAFVSDSSDKPTAIFENNNFNELNGAIGFIGADGASPLNLLEAIVLINNNQGSASYDATINKGLLFLDGSGTIHDAGTCKVYYTGNKHLPINRNPADYSSAHDEGGIGYKNTVYNALTITPETNIQIENSVYNYTRLLPSYAEVKKEATTSAKGITQLSNSIIGTSETKAATENAVKLAKEDAKSYADSLVIGLFDDRGNFDASVNTYPTSGGSGTAGAILKGDIWTINVAGIINGKAVAIGDTVRALIDTPAQTDANWAIVASDSTSAGTLVYIAGETIATGQAVNIYDDAGTAKVRLANATDDTKECAGYAKVGASLGGNVVVSFEGLVTSLSGLSTGKQVFLSTTGGEFTATAPQATGNLSQPLGVATSATTLRFEAKEGTIM